MNPKPRLLMVDDEPDMLMLLKRILAPELNWEFFTAASAQEALALLAHTPVDICLLDIKMPGMNGLDLLSRIRETSDAPTVVMMTAFGIIDLAVESIKRGAYDFITKPIDEIRLVITLKKAWEYHGLHHENRELQRRIRKESALKRIVGESAARQRVFDFIQTVSPSDATVLITGESGTGKELAARAIHELSLRNAMPFVAVNCPALPENILETELFGYVKGAFTDAKQDKKGLFQEAEGGTLLLAEIGELPLNLQTKLLRVLQEKAVKPIGTGKSVKVDVRVIASTNSDLKDQISRKRFREDLYYRLNVVSILLPPLRERAGDIPLLIRHFQRCFAVEFSKPGLKLSAESMQALMSHPWHGNVRELENTIKRGVILAKGDVVAPCELFTETSPECPNTSQGTLDLPYREAKDLILSSFNREYWTRLLSQNEGNVTHAARQCGMERQALQQILRRYGIHAEHFRERASR